MHLHLIYDVSPYSQKISYLGIMGIVNTVGKEYR